MKRRDFLKLNAGLAFALPFGPSLAQLIPTFTETADYEIHRSKIGKYTCTIINDLMFKYMGRDYFINAPEEDITKELGRYRQTTDHIPSPFNVMLLEQEGQKILIDTGIGFYKDALLFNGTPFQFKGRLLEILEKENIDTRQITHVILTHLHPDHIGGVYNESGGLNFPNAKYFIHEDEWNYWYSAGSDNQPPIFKHLVEINTAGLKDADLTLIRGKAYEILPAVVALQTPGHTPGQIALRIESEKDKMLYSSDAFLHPLHIEHLDWKTSFDLDHELARSSRTMLLELAYEENMQINAFHFDFPGLGMADKTGNSWKWIYSDQ